MAGRVLAQAFLANRASLLRYLRARGAGEDAEDCLQDLWIRIQAAIEPEMVEPLAYLYRMAHNLMLDRLRTAQRRLKRDNAYHEAVHGGNDGADDAPRAERLLIGRERLRAVDHVLAGLGARTEHIFRRHRVEEVGQRQIAAELGITLSAVEKHLQKAYRAIAAAQRAGASDGDPTSLGEPADDVR